MQRARSVGMPNISAISATSGREFEDTDIGAQVRALLRFDRQAGARCDYKRSSGHIRVWAGAEYVVLHRFPAPIPTTR